VVDEGARLLGIGVELQSELGRGSTFSLIFKPELVRVQPHAALMAERPPATPQEAGPALEGYKVLVVDDDEVICIGMASTLGAQGCDVVTADSIRVAVGLMDETGWTPDLLISDYQLAGNNDGQECIRQVRSHLQLEELPAVLLTGDVMVTLDSTFDPDTTCVLRKPLQPTVLLETILELRSRTHSA